MPAKSNLAECNNERSGRRRIAGFEYSTALNGGITKGYCLFKEGLERLHNRCHVVVIGLRNVAWVLTLSLSPPLARLREMTPPNEHTWSGRTLLGTPLHF